VLTSKRLRFHEIPPLFRLSQNNESYRNTFPKQTEFMRVRLGVREEPGNLGHKAKRGNMDLLGGWRLVWWEARLVTQSALQAAEVRRILDAIMWSNRSSLAGRPDQVGPGPGRVGPGDATRKFRLPPPTPHNCIKGETVNATAF